jgi:sugar/nucleoside kinase (ribokinase family)
VAEPADIDVSLVCVGNLTIDEARYGDRRVAPALGGDAAYAALAARLFSSRVSMLAPVGHDLASGLLTEIRDTGVRADALPMRDLATVRNIINYHADGSRVWEMLSSDEDFDALSIYPPDVPPAALAADGFVLLAMSLGAQVALTPWLRENSSARLYLDLQEDYVEGNQAALGDIVACCDVFLPSEVEAVALSGTTDLAAAARQFRAMGPDVVVIKRAERGSLVLDGDVLTEVPVAIARAVDSTGAGDAFCGAFAAVHLAGGDAVRAARAGARAAREAISDFGVRGILAAARRVHDSGHTLTRPAADGMTR